MKIRRLLLTVVIFFVNVSAGTGGLITHVDGRSPVSLQGRWHTIIDPYEIGYYNYRYEPDENGFFKNAKPKDKTDRIEYSFDSDQTLHVPGDWNSQDPRLFLYEGTIWYQKSFDYALGPNKRLFLHFGAVNYQAKVYLNGTLVGEHAGGFTPFTLEITDQVRDKNNDIVVKVDNKRLREAVPTVNTDWWNYGGITRRVLLVETPPTFIRDYVVQLEKGSRKTVAGWVQLDGPQKQQKITVGIPETGIKRTIKTDARGRASFSFNAKLELWSPESPKRYQVTLEAATDSIQDRIGFRSIETKGSEILLNGKPVYLRGICIHEEAPFQNGARAWSPEHARTLLGWAKELHCNFLRLAHYPHNEAMIRAADEMGLMVWSEIPVYWTITWENAATLASAKQQLAEMIQRDRNRAAVILWSMANETPLSDARLRFLKELAEQARQMDPTRLLTAAMERHYIDETTQMIDDPFGEFVDVLGCNEYLGWYDGLPKKADTITWKTVYNKPVVISEYGGGALAGFHGDALTRWSEEYQDSVYKHNIDMLAKVPFVRGMTPWLLKDFRSPRRQLPRIQDFWNRKGLISDQGQRKMAFQTLKAFYLQVAVHYRTRHSK